ncbi:MAG: PLP-dependent aminotransferase family protein [Myxococcota bacterium]
MRDLPLDGEGPLYDQIYRAMRDAILGGRVEAGTRLPTTRALAQELSISRNTVVSAFDPLRAEGYVVSRVGAGTFVATQIPSQAVSVEAGKRDASSGTKTPAAPRLSKYGQRLERQAPREAYDEVLGLSELVHDFRPCVPDLDRLPYESWRRHLVRTAQSMPNEDFDYANPEGLASLRTAIAAYLGRARGIVCDADEIVIVGGVAQALDLTTRVLLDEGDHVLLEDPHYLGARRSFEAAGARIVPGRVDSEGLDLTSVSAEDRAACRMAYLTPSHQFPKGSVLSLSRRLEVLAWANEANAFVLEDDYDSEFRYAGRAIPSLKSLDESDRVIYVGTFSKTLLPALRIAYVVLPRSLASLFRTAKWACDWSSPSFEQATLARHLESGEFERHLRRARTLYAEGRRVLVESIDDELGMFGPVYFDSQAGLHLLTRFEKVPASATTTLVQAGRVAGLGLYPAAPCYVGAVPEHAELVLGFGRLENAAIRQGIRRLKGVLESVSAA